MEEQFRQKCFSMVPNAVPHSVFYGTVLWEFKCYTYEITKFFNVDEVHIRHLRKKKQPKLVLTHAEFEAMEKLNG